MFKDIKLKSLYISSAVFTALNIVLIIYDVYWLSALPFALAIMLLFFFSLDKLILLLVFLTPLTFKYIHEGLGFTIDLPTEPVIVAIMLLFFFRLAYERQYDHRILKHPVSILLMLNLVWMFVTTVTSEIPLVSFKFFISRLWFVITFYFVAIYLFRDTDNMKKYMWLFGSALFVVVLIATYKHYLLGFERDVGYWVVRPFFNDHTHYAAVLALVAPFFIVTSFNPSDSVLRRRVALLVFVVFCAGILFSYSRASWVSIMVAFAGFIILVFRVKFRFIVAGLILVLGSLYLFQTEIIMELERNQQESSGEFSEHVRSISNITSDASNLERINRWRSAYRMYQERPVLGWGPGTYQFVYAPFQRAEDYTIITTHFGDLGNAHSEYIGPLAESGMPGMLLVVALALSVLATGVKLWKKAPTREMRLIALGLTLGLITYFTHGLLNNFLDTDKASVPFWGMMAILVAMDVFYKKR
ncbi:MAG: O-antigen ligase family protein [Bacteroidales bacterium]|nr:O-antigen ligase family protein [Bacteroidales bacterium]